MEKRRTLAIILAAGSGSRMKSTITKQQMLLFGKTLLNRCVGAFEQCRIVDEITVVCKDDELDFAKEQTQEFSKVKSIIPGGDTRAASAMAAVSLIEDDYDGIIMIHDCARCLISASDITAVADAAYVHGAATASAPVVDTVKLINSEGFVIDTVDRQKLRVAQTPQAFDFRLYKKAAEKSGCDAEITDDNMLMERIGYPVLAVETSRNNIKITTPEDIALAEYLISRNGDIYE